MGEKPAMSPAGMEEQPLKPRALPLYKRRKCRACCGVCVIVLIALAIVAIALSQTIFKFRDPKVTLVNLKLQNVSLSFDLTSISTLLDLSFSSDVRIDNPNYYDFRYSTSGLTVLYHGEQVATGELAAGTIRSRKTVDLPATITVEAVKLLVNALPDISSDVASLTINTVVAGRVNLAHLIKKHATATLNCTVDVIISNQTLGSYHCKRTIKL